MLIRRISTDLKIKTKTCNALSFAGDVRSGLARCENTGLARWVIVNPESAAADEECGLIVTSFCDVVCVHSRRSRAAKFLKTENPTA